MTPPPIHPDDEIDTRIAVIIVTLSALVVVGFIVMALT